MSKTYSGKTYSSYHTKKDIALCFGERTGMFVEPKEIRVRGDWLFYKLPDGDGIIDCYRANNARYDSGVLCMEPVSYTHLRAHET